MTNDRTTINVEKAAHRAAQEAKEDDETWSDYLRRCTAQEALETDPVAQVEVDGASIRDEIQQAVHDQLDQITINVDMGDLDLDGSELTAEDVESIVTREIEKHVHERARQKL